VISLVFNYGKVGTAVRIQIAADEVGIFAILDRCFITELLFELYSIAVRGD
jgi:hypothetical protein